MRSDTLVAALVGSVLYLPGSSTPAAAADNAICISVEKANDVRGACNIFLAKETPEIAGAYEIRRGDILEYDLLLPPGIPSVGGGLDLQFFGASGLFGLLAANAPTVLEQNIEQLRQAIGRWQHFQVTLDLAAGKRIERCLLRIEGNRPGLYQVAVDDIRITHEGKPQIAFYSNEESFNITIQQITQFGSPQIIVFDRGKTASSADLAGLMARLYQSSKTARRAQTAAQGLRMLKQEYDRIGRPPEFAVVDRVDQDFRELKASRRIEEKQFETGLNNLIAEAEPLRPFAKRFTIHAIAYAHLDFIWLWNWNETVETAVHDFRQMLQFLDEFPQFTFTYTSPALFHAIETKDSALFAEIRQRVKQGRWEMAGSRWCESDHNLISEESHARHFLYAQRYNQEKFGTQTTVCFEPDIFGHLATLPQMLKKSGLKYYVAGRTGVSPPVFWWQGLDGTRVLGYAPHHYSEILNENVLNFALTTEQRRLGYTDAPVIYGVGNHGGGPSRDQIVTGMALDKLSLYPSVLFSTLQRFMDKIASQPSTRNARVIENEIHQSLRGSYTTHAQTKRINRACENALVTAESFDVISQMLGIGARPVSFDPWWRSLLWCHHHDTIGGTTIKTSDQFAQQVLGDVLGMVTNHLQQTLSNLTEAIDTRGVSDHSRVVFNPLAWPVTAPAWMSLPDETNRWEWVDPTGHSAPVQRTEDGRGVAVLGPLPPLGYRVGCLRAANGKAPGGLTRSDFLCRNRQLEMEISPQSGNIRRLVDRDSQQNWVPENLQSGRLRIDFESPHEMSAWEIGPIERTEWLDKAEAVNCIEEGPVRVVFRSKYKFQNSTLQKDIILYRDLDRVDFELLVDWKERGDFQHAAPMLRIEFPSALQKPRAVWLIPFGAIQRSQDALDYAASYGMGFDAEQGSICLVNNSKNGYSAREGTLRLTLLRSSYHPDPEPDVGLHRIPLALEISGRGWEKAGMARKGIEFNRQPTVIEAKPHRGKFPSQQSFVAVEPETIVLTALKPSFASPTNFVARLYQSAGTPATARLISCLPFGPWIKTDLIERSSPNEPAVETSSLPVHGWEIKTYMSRQPKLSN